MNNDFNILENMKMVFSKNPVLAKDKYLENFLDYLRKNPSKLGKGWEDFSTQLKIDKKELESNILEITATYVWQEKIKVL